jgi:K+-dependent Na+/Ca+ exchanger-like protein
MGLLILAVVALLISFYYLNEIADVYFIPSLDKISRRFKMSDDAAGATLMAAGSSAPELFIAIIALLKGGDNLEIGVGTIVGSALFNLLVIIGAAALVRRSRIAWQPMLRDLLFYLFSIIMLYWAFSSGSISMVHGLIFIGFYLVYVFAVINWRKIFPYKDEELEEEQEDDDPNWKKYLKPFDKLLAMLFPKPKYYFTTFVISIVLIAGLSWALVESAVHISDVLGVPKYIIALTILAFGTSVPDMISSIIVAKQGRGGMAVSNALGSNIFDILIGLGLPWLIHVIVSGAALDIPAATTANLSGQIILLLASIVGTLGILLISKWWINKRVGYLLIGAYLIYLVFTIFKGAF